MISTGGMPVYTTFAGVVGRIQILRHELAVGNRALFAGVL